MLNVICKNMTSEKFGMGGEQTLVEKEEDPKRVVHFGDVTDPYNAQGQDAIENGWVRVEKDNSGEIIRAFITVTGQAELKRQMQASREAGMMLRGSRSPKPPEAEEEVVEKPVQIDTAKVLGKLRDIIAKYGLNEVKVESQGGGMLILSWFELDKSGTTGRRVSVLGSSVAELRDGLDTYHVSGKSTSSLKN